MKLIEITEEEIDRMADNFVNTQYFTRVYSVARKAECGVFWKYGFLAGLKAGRPKWHKVADGDYPPCETEYYTINVLTDKGDIAYYSYNYDCWIAEPSSNEIDPPIAWCEIPKYTEEENGR